MNNFFSQLKKEAQKIRLSTREREVMRLALENAMHSRSLLKSPIRVTRSLHVFFFAPRIVSSLAFVLILAVVGGSTAYAAEAAVPGDFLYSIKVNVNEPVRTALAQSPQAKASWHTEAVERRMKEAEVLAARGSLTADVKTQLETNFEEHATAVEKVVALVEDEDPVTAADISTRLESSITAHGAVIARLGEGGESEESRRESGDFARVLKERGRRIARADHGVSVSAERSDSGGIAMRAFSKGTTSTLTATIIIRHSDEAVVTRIERNASTTLEEAEAQLSVLKESLDATTSARVKAQIGKIRALIEKFRKEKGKTSSDEKEKIEQLLKDAATMKAFLEAQEEFSEHVLFPAPEVGENGGSGENGKDEKDGSSGG